jgi:hypothetical protein
LFIHWPVTGVDAETVTPPLADIWKGMEEPNSRRAMGLRRRRSEELLHNDYYAIIVDTF